MAAITTPTTQPVSPAQLYQPVAGLLDAVKTSLTQLVPPESALLAETVAYSLTSGGKLLRPAVTLLCAQATGQPKPADLVEVAAVSEMIHIATLLHDDVLDEADLRRGRSTVRQTWGNTVSVLSGDFLLAHASLKLAKIGNIRLVAIFSQVLADLCDGEVEQIRSSYHLDTPWESYFRKTLCKTASLFAAGCEAAGVLNQLPETNIQALKAYGQNFGIAFQIVDDLLDYTSTEAELGKPVFDDLKNGLLNAPILLALESDALRATEKAAMTQAIEILFEEAETDQHPQAVEAIRAFLEKTDAISATQALAQQYAQQAEAALDFIPDSVEKVSLRGLVQAAIYRSK